MLQRVAVKGFRSLADFELDIREGLNVLVGPNGAGKTNIILFFEFLRSVAWNQVRDAVGSAGGVSQVFQKKGKQRFHDRLEALIKGGFDRDGVTYEYTLSFAVKFDMGSQDVYFVEQSFQFRVAGSSDHLTEVAWRLNSLADPSSDTLTVKFDRESRKKYEYLSKHFLGGTFLSAGTSRQRLLLPLIAMPDDLHGVVVDEIAGRFVLNVVPSHVKKPEDSTRSPGIETDGSGVAATLYAIKRGRDIFRDRTYKGRSMYGDRINVTYDSVIDLIKVAVPSIRSIDVVNDPFDSRLKCQITVGGGSGSVVPLSSLSDGTVKWISLVLRLATSRSSLLLEEPENYLHPLMQREIVRLLRGQMSGGGFSIVSTHSETLLNAVKVDELVVVSYGTLGTRARRVTNAAQVEREINRTGFGLGYYYLADAVES